MQKSVQLPKNIPLTEKNWTPRMHFTKQALKSSAVFMFLTSLQYIFVLNKPIQVLVLSKQTHVGFYVPLFKNLRTASQRQHQNAKAEKSTECRTVFLSRYSCKAIVCLLWWQRPTERELSSC